MTPSKHNPQETIAIAGFVAVLLWFAFEWRHSETMLHSLGVW